MQIRRIRYIPGPNIYHNKPILIMTLDLEDLADVCSLDLPGFIPRLLDVLPKLQKHHCSPGRPGGFVERLHRGTYFAHIVEHIALELSDAVEIPVTYGKSIYAGEHGVYDVIVRAKSEEGMTEVLRIAVGLAEALARNVAFPLDERLASAKRIVSRNMLGAEHAGYRRSSAGPRHSVAAAQYRKLSATRIRQIS